MTDDTPRERIIEAVLNQWADAIESATICANANGLCRECELDNDRERCWVYSRDRSEVDVFCIRDLAAALRGDPR